MPSEQANQGFKIPLLSLVNPRVALELPGDPYIGELGSGPLDIIYKWWVVCCADITLDSACGFLDSPPMNQAVHEAIQHPIHSAIRGAFQNPATR